MKKQEFYEVKDFPEYILIIPDDELLPYCGIEIYSTISKRNLSQRVDTHGYKSITLKRKSHRIHRLVAKTLIPNPNNLECVDHIDGNKLNNHPSNLQWLTSAQNTRKAQEMGVWKNPPKKYEIHYKNGEIEIIENARKFARDHGYRQEKIIDVAKGRRHSHKDIIKVITL